MNATAANATASRLPDPAQLVPELGELAKALYKVTSNGAVPRNLIALMQLRAGQIVGNTYLTALHIRTLRGINEPEERVSAVATWQDAPYFTDAERVALELVDAVLQPSPRGERVPDELYARVAEHYDDKGIATLAMVIGQVGFFVPLAVIGKPLPDTSPSKQWRAAE